MTSCLIVTSHDIIHERNKTEGMTCLVRMPTNDLPARASAAATLAQGNGGFLSLIFFLRGGSPLMFAGEPRSAHKRSCEKPRVAPRPGSEKWVCFGWCFWSRWIFSPPFLVAVDFWWWIFPALLNILKSGAPNDLKKSTAKIHHLSPRAVPAAHTDGRPNGTSSQPWRHRPQPRKARNE